MYVRFILFSSFSLYCHHQKTGLNMTQRRVRAVKMRMKMMMDMKTCLTPTLQKENIQTTIHTGKESSEKTLNQTMTSHIMYLE